MGLLRFLLALSIVLSHITYDIFTVIPAQMAVQIFFMLSGFYMALILKKKYPFSKQGYVVYITNRFLRIFPLYWILLFISLIFPLIFYNKEFMMQNQLYAYIERIGSIDFNSIIHAIWILIRNITLLLNTDSFITWYPNSRILLVPQAWILQLILMFYIIAPFLVRMRFRTILFFIGVSLLIRFIILSQYPLYFLQSGFFVERFFLTQVVFFLLGILSYFLYTKFQDIFAKQKNIFIIFTVGLLVLIFYRFTFLNLFSYDPAGRMEIEWFLYFGLIFFIPYAFEAGKDRVLDSFFADISYPVFLSHYLVIQILEKYHVISSTNPWYIITIIGVTILFSVILMRMVEYPIHRYRQKRLQ